MCLDGHWAAGGGCRCGVAAEYTEGEREVGRGEDGDAADGHGEGDDAVSFSPPRLDVCQQAQLPGGSGQFTA
ncbi:MAG TPA: hypothetical protein VF062_03590 [Candidatus Limnocylindrales bacterium]